MLELRPGHHAAHDPLLIAAFACGEATGVDLARAASLVATCPACAELHRDLRVLRASLATTPAPARPRDFALTPERAQTLARPAARRRIAAPLSVLRFSAAPVAASLAALGVAGLLLGGAIRMDLGGAATAFTPRGQAGASGAAVNGGGELASPDTTYGMPTTGQDASTGPSAAASADVQTTAIDRMRAVEIARGARRAYATAGVIEVEIGTFADLGNAGVATVGPEPAPDRLVWSVNLGTALGPRRSAGAIVVIDARDGRVIQAFDWIS